jgi:hypothetical protein
MEAIRAVDTWARAEANRLAKGAAPQ